MVDDEDETMAATGVLTHSRRWCANDSSADGAGLPLRARCWRRSWLEISSADDRRARPRSASGGREVSMRIRQADDGESEAEAILQFMARVRRHRAA